MNLRRPTARIAVAGVSTALAGAALVGLGTTAAHAEAASGVYTCSIPGVFSSDFAITASGGLPAPQFYAGAPVPAGLVRVTLTSALTPLQVGSLGSFGIIGAKSNDFALGFGSTSIPLAVDGTFAAAGGVTTWTATGQNAPFVTPDPGLVDVVLPSAFTMILKTAGGDFAAPLGCVIKDGATPAALASDFPLGQQLSQTVATPSSGKRPSVLATVTSTSWGPTVPTGKVVAKEGKKVVGSGTLDQGSVLIKLTKKLQPGKHKITLSYVGIPSIKGSSTKTVVKKR